MIKVVPQCYIERNCFRGDLDGLGLSTGSKIQEVNNLLFSGILNLKLVNNSFFPLKKVTFWCFLPCLCNFPAKSNNTTTTSHPHQPTLGCNKGGRMHFLLKNDDILNYSYATNVHFLQLQCDAKRCTGYFPLLTFEH